MRRGCRPNFVPYTSLVKGLCAQNTIVQASRLFKKMVKLAFQANVITCSILFNGFIKLEIQVFQISYMKK